MLIEEKIQIHFLGISITQFKKFVQWSARLCDALLFFRFGRYCDFQNKPKVCFCFHHCAPTFNDSMKLILFSVTSLLTLNSIWYNHSPCLSNSTELRSLVVGLIISYKTNYQTNPINKSDNMRTTNSPTHTHTRQAYETIYAPHLIAIYCISEKKKAEQQQPWFDV